MGEVISLEKVRSQRELREYINWVVGPNSSQDPLIDYELLSSNIIRRNNTTYFID